MRRSKQLDDALQVMLSRQVLDTNLTWDAVNTLHRSIINRGPSPIPPDILLPTPCASPIPSDSASTPPIQESRSPPIVEKSEVRVSIEEPILQNGHANQPWTEPITYSPIQVLIDSPRAVEPPHPSTLPSSSREAEDLASLPEISEQEVLRRICALRAEGKWSLTRLPMCLDLPRPKCHHDFLLEEAVMMSFDFRQEVKLKKAVAKMLAYSAAKLVREKRQAKNKLRNEPGTHPGCAQPTDFKTTGLQQASKAWQSPSTAADSAQIEEVQVPMSRSQRCCYDQCMKSERFQKWLSSALPKDQLAALNTLRLITLHPMLVPETKCPVLNQRTESPSDVGTCWDGWKHLRLPRVSKPAQRSRSQPPTYASSLSSTLDQLPQLSLVQQKLSALQLASHLNLPPLTNPDQPLHRLHSWAKAVRDSAAHPELSHNLLQTHFVRLWTSAAAFTRRKVADLLTKWDLDDTKKSAKTEFILKQTLTSSENLLILTSSKSFANRLNNLFEMVDVDSHVLVDDNAIKSFNVSLNSRIAVVTTDGLDKLDKLNVAKIDRTIVLDLDIDCEKWEKVKSLTKSQRKVSLLITPGSVDQDLHKCRTNGNNLGEVVSRIRFNCTGQKSDSDLTVASACPPDATVFLNDPATKTEQLGLDVKNLPTIVPKCCLDVSPCSEVSAVSASDSGISCSYPLVYDSSAEECGLLKELAEAPWNTNNVFKDEDDMLLVDGLANPWYTGDLIEPDPFSFADDLSPMEFMDDNPNQALEVNVELDAAYFGDSMGLSPASADDLVDDDGRTVTSTVDNDASLDAFMMENTPPPQPNLKSDMSEPPLKKGLGQKRKLEELMKKNYGNQVIAFADPNPIVRPDGKPGFTPAPFPTEWIDADVPAWTVIEDTCLLKAVLSQLNACPVPGYICRNFCLNWEVITLAVGRVSFHVRTPYRCCTRFRELIGAQKKLAPTENADLASNSFDGLNLSAVHDERVKASTLPSTRCYMRTITILLRKHAELRKTKLIWQKRVDLLNEMDEVRSYGHLRVLLNKSSTYSTNLPSQQVLYLESRGVNHPHVDQPHRIVDVTKRPNPPNIYQQYSRRLRLLRVINTAHSFINKNLKESAPLPPIVPFYGTPTLHDGRTFHMSGENQQWSEQVHWLNNSFSYRTPNYPRIESVLEKRCIYWPSEEAVNEPRPTNEHIAHVRSQVHPIDVRTPSSQKNAVDSLKIACKFIKVSENPKKPCFNMDNRASLKNNLVKVTLPTDIKEETVKSINRRHDQNRSSFILLTNGNSVLQVADEDRHINTTVPMRPTHCNAITNAAKIAAEQIEAVEGLMRDVPDDVVEEVWTTLKPSVENVAKELAACEEQEELSKWLNYDYMKFLGLLSKKESKSENETGQAQVDVVLRVSKVPKRRNATKFAIRLTDSVELLQIPSASADFPDETWYSVLIQQELLCNMVATLKPNAVPSFDRLSAISQARDIDRVFNFTVKLTPDLLPNKVKPLRSVRKFVAPLLSKLSENRARFVDRDHNSAAFVMGSSEAETNTVKITLSKEVIDKIRNANVNEVEVVEVEDDVVPDVKVSPEKPSTSLTSFSTILAEHVEKLTHLMDEMKQKAGLPTSAKHDQKEDEFRVVVLLELDACTENWAQLNLHKAKIRVGLDDEDDETVLTFVAHKPKNVISMKTDYDNRSVRFNVLVKDDPFEDLEKKQPTACVKESENELAALFIRPNINNRIMAQLGALSQHERTKWLNVLKYRYLRRKMLRLDKKYNRKAVVATAGSDTSKENGAPKSGIRQRLAKMRQQANGEAKATEPTKSAHDSTTTTPPNTDNNSPVEDESQIPKVGSIHELMLATKLKTTESTSDLLATTWLQKDDLPGEFAHSNKFYGITFPKLNKDVFVTDKDVHVNLDGKPNKVTTPDPLKREEIKNPLDVLRLPSMGPSKIMKMRAAKVPERIRRLQEQYESRRQLETQHSSTESSEEPTTATTPNEGPEPPQQFYQGQQRKVVTYPEPVVNQHGQRVVMVRSGHPAIHQRHVQGSGGQVRTYAVSQMHIPPPQQHYTSTGQPVSIHHNIQPHAQQYVYSQSPVPATYSEYVHPSASTAGGLVYRQTVKKDRPVPSKIMPKGVVRPDQRGVSVQVARKNVQGRMEGGQTLVYSDQPNRELTVREKIQRDMALAVDPNDPRRRIPPGFGTKSASSSQPHHPLYHKQPAQPGLKRRLEDAMDMDGDKRQKLSDAAYAPAQQQVRISPTEAGQYVVQSGGGSSTEYTPLEIRLQLQDSQGNPVPCQSSAKPEASGEGGDGHALEHESSVVPVQTSRGMEYRVQIPRLPQDDGRQYQIKLSIPGQSTAQVYGVPDETPVKDVLEMRQQPSRPGALPPSKPVQLIQPQGPSGPQYLQFQYHPAKGQQEHRGPDQQPSASGESVKKTIQKPVHKTIQQGTRRIVEYHMPSKTKPRDPQDKRPQTIDTKQPRPQPKQGLARPGQPRSISIPTGQGSRPSSHPATPTSAAAPSDHPIPSTISTAQRQTPPSAPSTVPNPRQRRVPQVQRVSVSSASPAQRAAKPPPKRPDEPTRN